MDNFIKNGGGLKILKNFEVFYLDADSGSTYPTTYTCKYSGSVVLNLRFTNSKTSFTPPKVNGTVVSQYYAITEDSGWTNWFGFYIFQVSKGDVISMGTYNLCMFGINIENATACVTSYKFDAENAIDLSVKAPKGYTIFAMNNTTKTNTFTYSGTQGETTRYGNKGISVCGTKEATTLKAHVDSGVTPTGVIVGYF